MSFELTNEQRAYFGMEPIESNWERVPFKGDAYRPASILYYDGDVIKRHIISTDERYEENQYNENTRDRSYLLPVTAKGKEKKLSPSVLEARQPKGIYCFMNDRGRVLIGQYNTQATFYDSGWEIHDLEQVEPISRTVSKFIASTPEDHLKEIGLFKEAKRKNAKFKPGDIFAFKINLTEYGFGRILLDIDALRTKKLISDGHGLSFIMGRPVLIKLYVHVAKTKYADLDNLINSPSLPSDYIMDNHLFYGDYEIIGHRPLRANDMDFPMSYGRHIDSRKNCIFFQWGLINVELSPTAFDKYLVADNPFVKGSSPSRRSTNPYGYYSVGFSPGYDIIDIKQTIAKQALFDFRYSKGYKPYFDLRNPSNQNVKNEIMKSFGLKPDKTYNDNCILSNTISLTELLKAL